MNFEKITDNVENITLLPDDPTLTPEQLKKEFDKGNKTIKEAFNRLIDELRSIKENKLENNYISAYLEQNLTIQSNSIDIVPLTLKEKSGEKLRIENNYIIVGKGVSKIRFSASVFHEGATNGSYVFDYVSLTSDNVTKNIGTAIASIGGSGYASIPIVSDIQEVKEGDKIFLRVNTNSGNQSGIRKGESTKICVEVVE